MPATQFNNHSKEYEVYALWQKQIAKNFAQTISEQIESPASIFEIGCGTGFLTQFLLDIFPNTRYNASDISKNMLSLCHEKLNHNKNTNFQIFNADTDSINHSFDLITSSLAFQWLENLECTMKKLYEALTPNGKLIFNLPIEGTYIRLKKTFKECKIPFNGLNFHNKEMIKNIFTTFPGKILSDKTSIIHFHNTLDFFKDLHNIGAISSQNQSLTPGQFKTILKEYDSQFSNKIEIEYRVLTVCIQRDLL